MTRPRHWLAVFSVITVVVFLIVGSTAPAHSVVPEVVGAPGSASAPVTPSPSGAAAGQARRDGVEVNGVVDAVMRRRTADRTATVAAGPRLGPEHPVADAVPAPARGDQTRPDVAFDGTNYLVVWTDGRPQEGLDLENDILNEVDVFGARVSRSGAVLDPIGIPIAAATDGQGDPEVVFDGTNFFVAWVTSTPDGTSDIYGTRVSRSGTVLDASGIPISTVPGWQHSPAVAFDGTNFLVVWVTEDGISGSRVTPAGVVLDPAGIPISGVAAFEVVLAFDGTNYLVAWAYGGDLFGALVSRQGAVLASRAIVADPGDQREPAIAFDGINYLLTWTDNRANADRSEIYGTRVDTAGNALDATRIRVSPTNGYQIGSTIAFDGTNLLVTWTDFAFEGGSLRGARVTRAGVVLDSGGRAIATTGSNLNAVAFDGTNFLVIWNSDFMQAPADVVGVRVSTTVTVVGEDFVVSISANAQTSPALAFDGTNYVVVWDDSRHGATEIFGARVTPAGQILDGAGFFIATAPAGKVIADAAVAFDGTNFLVVWSLYDRGGESGDVRGARVSRAGVVLDDPSIPVSTAASRKSGVALAFDGSNYLVVWTDEVLGTGPKTRGARVSRAGAVLGSPFLVSNLEPRAEPAVAFDGANYVVTGVTYSGRVYWTRVAPDGRVVDLHIIVTRPASRSDMAVASDGTNTLIVWTDERDGTNSIYGTRIDRSGNALDPTGFPIGNAPGHQRQPAIVVNGPFLVVWRDQRRGLREYDVYGARVRGNGQVIDPAGFAIAATPAWDVRPAVAVGPGDRFGVVTQRYVVDAPYRTQRVFLRTVSPK